MFELLLLIASALAAYTAWLTLRVGRRSGALALLVVAVTAGGAAVAGADAGGTAGAVGAVALGAAACLLVIGPTVRAAARRAMAADRLKLARGLFDVAEILQPGAGVRDDKAGLAALVHVRAGKVDEVVAAIQRARAAAPSTLRRVFDERIAMLYLVADQPEQALAFVDRQFGTEVAAALDGSVAPDAAEAAGRPRLPLSPALWVELVDTHARRGELARAAAMVAHFELAAGEAPGAYPFRHHARVVLLAWAGRVDAVTPLLTPRAARHFSRAARAYWLGLARARAGEAALAHVAFTAARRGARYRLQRQVEAALTTPPGAAALDGELAAVVDAAVAAPLPLPPAPVRRGAVLALVAVTVAWSAAIALGVGPLGDPGAQLRSGAATTPAVLGGEWWRLIAATFVHVGIVHVVLGVLLLWMVGRWVELLLGGWATLAIFGLAAAGGTAVSLLAGGVGLRAGESTAVMGLVGALLAELIVRRRRHQLVWRRGVGTSLMMVAVLHLGLGLLLPSSQQAGDGAGLAIGALVGLALSPHARGGGAARRWVARAVGGLVLVAVVVSAALVLATPVTATFDRGGLRQRVVSGVVVTAPARWELASGELGDPDLYMRVLVARSELPLAAAFAAWQTSEPAASRARGFDESVPAPSIVTLPDGMLGAARTVTAADALEQRQRYHLVLAGRSLGGGTVLVAVYVPATLAAPLATRLTAMLASVAAAE